MSVVPTKKIRGAVIRVRNTLDFLLQTQKYIQKIRTPAAHPQPVLARCVTRKSTKHPSLKTLPSPRLSKSPTLGSHLVVLPTSPRPPLLTVKLTTLQDRNSPPASLKDMNWSRPLRTVRSIGSSSEFLSTFSDALSPRSRFGLVSSRCQSPVKDYIRLSKTAGSRRKRLAP